MARKKKSKGKPPTELKLDELQKRYLEDPNNTEVFQKLFSLLKVYARSLALKEIKTKLYLDPDHIEGIAVDATLKLLKQYKKPGWKVWGSFAGALRWKVVEALYQDVNEESAQSLNTIIGDGSQELEDVLDKIGATILWSKEAQINPEQAFLYKNNAVFAEIEEVLADAREVLPYRAEFLFHIYLLLRLRRPKTRLTLPSFREFFLDSKMEDAFELLLLEIRNRIEKHTM